MYSPIEKVFLGFCASGRKWKKRDDKRKDFCDLEEGLLFAEKEKSTHFLEFDKESQKMTENSIWTMPSADDRSARARIPGELSRAPAELWPGGYSWFCFQNPWEILGPPWEINEINKTYWFYWFPMNRARKLFSLKFFWKNFSKFFKHF